MGNYGFALQKHQKPVTASEGFWGTIIKDYSFKFKYSLTFPKDIEKYKSTKLNAFLYFVLVAFAKRI